VVSVAVTAVVLAVEAEVALVAVVAAEVVVAEPVVAFEVAEAAAVEVAAVEVAWAAQEEPRRSPWSRIVMKACL